MRTFFPLNAQAWTLYRENSTVFRAFIAGQGVRVSESDGGLRMPDGHYLSKRPGADAGVFEVRDSAGAWEVVTINGNSGTFSPDDASVGYGFLLI